ncbi:short chain dehydrogenase/reductase [Ophiocordyceps sinensis CO18]|uniref:Short chain dehydrogenase/reductase n=1 Tax=Ophiocordyceps sinensis (strain Co18 / CGMCC 3.14243) TaxID=911162 RepID=T5ACX9_OPHSC|nr:short chain dehydrogenase/reductase [Ophiocordyceps sinensis CO18]
MASHQLTRNQLFDVSHVTAVLTGAGSGIGLMMAQALVANGARVYVVDRRKEALDTVGLRPLTGSRLVADISVKEDVVRLAGEVAALEPDGIQLLVNNAGIALDHGTRFAEHGRPSMGDARAVSEHFMRSAPGDWTRSFETNVMGGYFMSMALLPLLERGSGAVPGYSSSVVNLSSNAAFLKDACRGYVSYAASKAGTVHLSRMLATLFCGTSVRVNQIAPGTFPSEMTTGSSGPDQKSTMNRPVTNAAGRPGGETDIAATILLLASVGGSFYNHQILFPDGGETLISPAAV